MNKLILTLILCASIVVLKGQDNPKEKSMEYYAYSLIMSFESIDSSTLGEIIINWGEKTNVQLLNRRQKKRLYNHMVKRFSAES